MQKQIAIYRGKSKTLYNTEHPERLILEFRDDTSSLNGRHVEQLACKGAINNKINHFIMHRLQQAGIPTQMEQLLSDNQALVKKLTMLPIECVVRNRAAGSLCRRLGIAEGTVLTPPTFELFLKNDALDDPMINDAYCITFGWTTETQCAQIKALSFQVNELLTALFDKAGLWLIDFKLEFGLFNGQIVLGDELSPDSCRIWDQKTLNKLDKDRFRQGLGGVVAAYQELAQRLGIDLT